MKQRLPAAGLAFAALLAGAVPAAAAVGDWVEGDHARIRLVAAGVDAEGNLSAGLEIELDPGWHTYWRTPGDAGVAPVFDFAGSVNIDEPVVSYPVPTRLDDGFTVSNVYEDYVLLPLSARVNSAEHATDLALKLDIGVCAEVCIPVQFETRLSVPPVETDVAATRLIAAAREKVPAATEPGVLDVNAAAMTGGTEKRPVFEVKATVADSKAATVFVEGPADWYGAPPQLVSAAGPEAVYRIEFDRLTAKTPISGSALRVTLVAGGRAVEKSVTLD